MLIEIVIENEFCPFSSTANLHYEKFSDGTIKCIQDDIPFKLPPRWEWCRLKSICSVLTDGTHQTPTYSDCGYVFLSSKNVTEGRIDWDNVMFIPENLHKELYTRIAPKLNDILLAKNGTTGVAAIVDKDCVFDIYVSLALIRIVSDIISPQYILNAIGSYFVQSFFKKSLKGIGVPNLHLERIRETLLPIPPYNEQIKITKTTNNLISLCEKIGSEKNSLSSLVTLAKNKILDLAIRGKLVSQDPNDEPASILLERIRKEKEELVKSGKLKRDKRESVIFRGEDNSYYEKIDMEVRCINSEIPFDLPETWCWCRLGTLFAHNTGKALNSADSAGTPMTYITTSNLYWDRFELDSLKEMLFADSEIDKCTVKKGDLLVCEGGDIGRSAIWMFEENIRIQNHIHRLRPYISLSNRFYYYVMYMWKQLGLIGGQGIGLQGFSSKMLHNLIVPLPSIDEQERIVAFIDKLFEQIESIEKSFS